MRWQSVSKAKNYQEHKPSATHSKAIAHEIINNLFRSEMASRHSSSQDAPEDVAEAISDDTAGDDAAPEE